MSIDNITLVPFDHTYILYSPENPLSLPLAATSLFPILVLVFLFSWHIVTREVEPCIFAAGHVCNDLISGIFKNLVKYPRPLRGQVFKQDGGLVWGMPSSHSQFMSFWFTYTYFTYIQNYPQYQLSTAEKIFYSLGGLGVVALVVASRILFQYHNWFQVIVGLILGNTLASAYFLLVCLLREYGIIDMILNTKIMKWWKMKDSIGSGRFLTLEQEREAWESSVGINKD